MNASEHIGNKYCPISKDKCPGVCIYADIMENVHLGIIVFDMKNKEVKFQNQSAINMFNNLIKPKDFEALCKHLIPNIEDFTFSPPKYSSRSINLGDRMLGYSAYRISENFIWLLILDITEKTRLESIAEAVNAMNNIGYIFSGIRHEIGNPINSIKVTMSVLKNNIDTYSRKTVLKYIDRTLEEIGCIEYLLRLLKNFNMFENPDIKQVRIPSFIERFVSLVRNDFEKNGITIITNIHHEAEWGYTDPRALHQVLLNIMANASDALQEREAPQISINVRPLQNLILLSIKDNGCGISAEQKKDLFKPFITNKQNGTGLGLVIARKMLLKMDSTIDIESRENVGTRVNIIIPGNRNWELNG